MFPQMASFSRLPHDEKECLKPIRVKIARGNKGMTRLGTVVQDGHSGIVFLEPIGSVGKVDFQIQNEPVARVRGMRYMNTQLLKTIAERAGYPVMSFSNTFYDGRIDIILP
jgi:hypothetical protein